MPGRNFGPRFRVRLAAAAILALPAGLALHSVAQHIETSTFNQAPLRPKEDPKVVARGKSLYDKQCASCHSADLRGVEDKGPNLLRSQPALVDHHGEELVPLMHGQGIPNHKFDLSDDDANAVAAYVRSILSEIGSQGRPPGDASRSPNVVVGDAAAGQQYFQQKCASCHSADGDLKGFAKKVPSPKLLQAAWLRGTHLGKAAPPVTVKITEPGKPVMQGTLIHIDDFLVTMTTQDGTMETIRRQGAVPKVEVDDPLDAHRKMLPTLSDKNIHDLTAYLVTLK